MKIFRPFFSDDDRLRHSHKNNFQIVKDESNMTKKEQLKATIDNLQSALNEAKEELNKLNKPEIEVG